MSTSANDLPPQGAYSDFDITAPCADGDMILDRLIQASKLGKTSSSCESLDARSSTSTRSARSSVSSIDAPSDRYHNNTTEAYNSWRMRWL